MKSITTVIINFQTPELLNVAVSSFKTSYPDVKVIVIDNGSKDEGKSKAVIEKLESDFSNIESIFFKKNIFHGPAMDLAIREYVDSKFTFFLDSDTETIKSGFLEEMITSLKLSEMTYGIGETVRVNKRGYKSDVGINILQTPYVIIKNDIYKSLRPFVHHGQPCMYNFIDAKNKGYKLLEFAVSKYIDHLWRGTAGKFGYGLGIKGKIGFILNKLGL